MTDEEADKIVASAALDVPSKPVPHSALLEALLDQIDHYVAEKVSDLFDMTEVAPRSGVALVVRNGDRAIVPPGATWREVGDFDVLFYSERFRDTPPWVGTAEAADPCILVPCVNACARWGDGDEDIVEYPWGYLHLRPRDLGLSTGPQRQQDPAAFHAESFASGHLYGTVAVAAGRLGEEVLAIVTTRWLFPLTKKADRS